MAVAEIDSFSEDIETAARMNASAASVFWQPKYFSCDCDGLFFPSKSLDVVYIYSCVCVMFIWHLYSQTFTYIYIEIISTNQNIIQLVYVNIETMKWYFK